MSKDSQISATEAKLRFGDILDRCTYGHEDVIITKHGKPVAVMLDINTYNQRQNSTTPLLQRFNELQNQARDFRRNQNTKPNSCDTLNDIREERLTKLTQNHEDS